PAPRQASGEGMASKVIDLPLPAVTVMVAEYSVGVAGRCVTVSSTPYESGRPSCSAMTARRADGYGSGPAYGVRQSTSATMSPPPLAKMLTRYSPAGPRG